MRELIEVLVGAGSTLESKRIAAEALGDLRERTAVEPLAHMLGSVDGVLAERCQRALKRITFNDFGFSGRRWIGWWEENRGRHRIEWAADSLNHRVEDIRLAAASELKRMVGDAVEWPEGPMDHGARKTLRRRLEAWWESEGRALHPLEDR